MRSKLFRVILNRNRANLAFDFALMVGILIISLAATAIDAVSQDVTDAEVKAALTFKFPVYVRWPEEALADDGGVFHCCVFGDGRLSDLLNAFNGETLMGKTVQVRKISDTDALGSCHVLFIGSSAEKMLPAILTSVRDKPVLTIGEVAGFARRGGVINLVRQNDSVGFEINPEAGRRAGLKISSKLLRLAKIVEAP